MGTGRLDRIEALLDKLATSHCLHDERLSRVEIAHEENEERWKRTDERFESWRKEEEAYRQTQRERDGVMDERIGKLVLAIGGLVSRLIQPALGGESGEPRPPHPRPHD